MDSSGIAHEGVAARTAALTKQRAVCTCIVHGRTQQCQCVTVLKNKGPIFFRQTSHYAASALRAQPEMRRAIRHLVYYSTRASKQRTGYGRTPRLQRRPSCSGVRPPHTTYSTKVKRSTKPSLPRIRSAPYTPMFCCFRGWVVLRKTDGLFVCVPSDLTPGRT